MSRAAQGQDAVSQYLSGFLESFDVRFAILEEHRLEGRDAAIVLWQCAARRRLPEQQASKSLVMQRGMSLIEFATDSSRETRPTRTLLRLSPCFDRLDDVPSDVSACGVASRIEVPHVEARLRQRHRLLRRIMSKGSSEARSV